MATGSGSRDVTLTLTVDTLGEEGIKQLQTAVSSLAGAGTSAGPEFQKLADQIARLGEQNTALQAVKSLAEQTDKLAQEQESATQRTQALADKLDALKQAAVAASQKQLEAKHAVNEAKKANVEYTAEITKLRSEFDAAGKKTDEYKTKFRELTDKQAEAKKKIIDLRDAQKAANTEYGQAQSAVSKLTSEYERESASAAKAVQATNDKRTALNNAAEQAGKLGVVTTDLATAERNLIAVFNRGVTAVNERKAALVEMAESDRLLAIQEQAQIELLKRGEQALQAEVLALRDAERSIQAYEAAKAKATADEQAWQREAFAIVEAEEAAQKLAHETEVLSAAQKELAQQKAFEQLANEAKKMADAAEYVRFWETELAKAEQQVRQTADATTAAGAKIQDAFKTVGVRSAQELKDEIAKTKAAMETLAAESTATGNTLKGVFDAGNAKINALERDLRELNGTMTLGDKTAKLFSGALGQIAAGNLVADGVGYLVQKVKDLGVEFFTVNLEAQRLSKALGQVYGDSGLAAKQFAFLRETADKSGLSVRDLSDGFIRFSAAANSSGISLQNANALFIAVSKAAGQLGLSGDNVTGTLEALGQMASKGVVSMEELRQQLGDRLPGAMAIAAKGLGVTQDQLVKMVESGSLATKVFFPAFEKGLNETFTSGEKKIEGFIQGWNRLINAIVKTAQAASETSVFTKLGQVFDFVAERIGFVVKAVELLVARFAILKVVELATSFLGLGNAASKAAGDIATKAAAVEKDTIAAGANTVATGTNTAAITANTTATGLSTAAKAQNAAAWTAIGSALAATTPAIVGGAGSLQKAGEAATSATASKGLLVGAMGLLGAASTRLVGFLGGPIGALITLALYGKEAGIVIGETAAKMLGWGKALEDNEKKIAAIAEAERKLAEQRRAAANEQDIASAKAATAAANAVKQSELAVASAIAEVKAAQQKYAAVQDLIKIQGQDKESQEALLKAAEDILAANVKELAAKEKFVENTKKQIEIIDQVRDANGNLTQGQKEQIEKLEELANKRKSEADEQRETIRQAEIEVASRKLVTESLKDNSGRVDDLGKSYEDAKTKLKIMSESGVASLAQIQKAEIDVATAAGLYRDALKDVIRNAEIDLKQTAASIAAKDAQAGSRVKHLEVMLDEAKQQGRINDVTKLENQIKTENIEILERRKQLIAAEIEAGLKIIDAKRKEVTANTDEDIAKRKLLDVEEQLLLARKDSIKSIDEQIKGLKNSTAAVEGLTEAYHQLGIKTPQELQQIADKNAAAWEKVKNDGQASVSQLQTAFEKYAQSAVDAAGDMGREITEQMLKSEGATRGLNVAIDETGRVAVTSMAKAAGAINNARGYMTAFERSAISATEALEAQNAAVERRISALEKEIELAERAAELERKRQGVDKDGFRVDKDGNRIIIGVPTKAGVFDQAKSRGLDEGQSLQIANQFIGEDGSQIGWQQTGKSWSVALNEAIEKLILDNAARSISKSQDPNSLNSEFGRSNAVTTADRPTVVNIAMNGKTRRINTDPSGAQAIQDVLRGLETSSRTTA